VLSGVRVTAAHMSAERLFELFAALQAPELSCGAELGYGADLGCGSSAAWSCRFEAPQLTANSSTRANKPTPTQEWRQHAGGFTHDGGLGSTR